MKHLLVPVGFVLALSSRALGAPESDSTQAAKELLRQGSAEYSRQHWEAARAAFLKAWEIKHHYAIAANLAQVELRLGRYREAAEHLQYALANLPVEHADKRADVEASLKECRTHLSTVRVSVSVAQATVRLDGQPLAPEALADEILLDSGPHQLEAEKSGYLISQRAFTATAGEAREVRLDLLPQPPASNSEPVRPSYVASVIRRPQTSDSGSSGHDSQRNWVLGGGAAATAVAAGLGVFFTLRASSLKGDSDKLQRQVSVGASPTLPTMNAECAASNPMRPAATCDQLRQTNDKHASATAASNVSWIAAGALGVATLSTYLLWPTNEENRPAKALMSASLRLCSECAVAPC
ncbi:MAG: hypothetical protein ABJB12_02365 [Pseudomonadota bacterium]